MAIFQDYYMECMLYNVANTKGMVSSAFLIVTINIFEQIFFSYLIMIFSVSVDRQHMFIQRARIEFT